LEVKEKEVGVGVLFGSLARSTFWWDHKLEKVLNIKPIRIQKLMEP
jgi:hypothetical protein